MTKMDGLKARLADSKKAVMELSEGLDNAAKQARKQLKEASSEGMTAGALAASAAAIGTIVVDKVLQGLSGRWPWLAKYRKWLDFAIGIILVMIGKIKKSWAVVALAGFVWLAIQIFSFFANKVGLATGFSVEGTEDNTEVSGSDDEDIHLALVGACCAGLEDEDAYHIADVCETGIIVPAAAVAIPALLEIAQKYGPQAVQAVQAMIDAAKKKKKRPHAKGKVLAAREVKKVQDARQQEAVRKAHEAAIKAAHIPGPQTPTMPALPPASNADLMAALRAELTAELEKGLAHGRDQMSSRIKAWEAREASQASQASTQASQASQASTSDPAEEIAGARERMHARRQDRRADALVNAAQASTQTQTTDPDISTSYNQLATSA